MVSNWHELAVDLLYEISVRLNICDRIRFSTVCSNWRSASACNIPPLHQNPNCQQPFLISFPSSSSSSLSAGDLFTLSDPKKPISIPFPRGSRQIIGSLHGWLIIIGQRATIHLLNPITGSHVQLPSLTMPAALREALENLQLSFKAVLSSNPSDGHYWLAVACRNCNLNFYSSSLDEWGKGSDDLYRLDIIFHNHSLYMSTHQGIASDRKPLPLMTVEWIQTHQRIVSDGNCFRPLKTVNWIQQCRQRQLRYLVPSPWGDLLEVWWEAGSFSVHPNLQPERLNLGNYSLLVGRNSGVAISSVPELKGNCLYVADDDLLGVYNLEDGSMQQIFPGNLNHPIWIQPRFR